MEFSKRVDRGWSKRRPLNSIRITFPVPNTHPRSRVVKSYPLIVTGLSRFRFLQNDIILADQGIFKGLKRNKICLYIPLAPTEGDLKTLHGLQKLLLRLRNKERGRVIGIGGGIMMNVASYVAQKRSAELVLVPTTIIAMSDGGIGGKVRANEIKGGRFTKHAYKSFYEPSQIILDPRFLASFSNQQIQVGLAEIIKHALYQSNALAKYILSKNFDPFHNGRGLLKAILWNADLKRICLEVDPAESKNGSGIILRAAHDLSDKLEEKSKFKLPHGKAVLRAMKIDLRNTDRFELLQKIYKKIGVSA